MKPHIFVKMWNRIVYHVTRAKIRFHSNTVPYSCSCYSQFGEIFDTCIKSARVLGSLSHRYGIPTTLHGAIDNRDLQAREIGRAEHKRVFHTSSPTSCLLTFF